MPIANLETLMQLFNGLSDEQRLAFIQAMALPHAEGSSLTTASAGLNAEKLADKDIEIPSEYCCPISLSIMTDPVYILNDPTGTRFERSLITKWLTDHGTHPTTRVAYPPSALSPDMVLKETIDEFVESVEAATTFRASK